MLIIDKYAYSSTLAWTEPVIKIIFSLLMLFLCIGLNSLYVSIFLSIFFAFLTLYSNKSVSVAVYFKFISIPLIFLIFSILPVLIVFGSNSYLISFTDSFKAGITSESLNSSILIFFRAAGAISIVYFLSLSTPMINILDGLRKLKVPELIISIMELIYRYIFILLEEALLMYQAQKLRLGYNGFYSSIKCLSELSASLFIRAYNRADLSYQALLSRNFDGRLITADNEYKKSYLVYIMLIVLPLLCILLKVIYG